MGRDRKPAAASDRKRRPIHEAWQVVRAHPLLAPLAGRCQLGVAGSLIERGYAGVTERGVLLVNFDRRATPQEWTWVLAHLILHLGFDHFPTERNTFAWNVACDVVVHRFLRGMRLGHCPEALVCDLVPYAGSERTLYERFVLEGVPEDLRGISAGDPGQGDLLNRFRTTRNYDPPERWRELLAAGLVQAVRSTVERAAGIPEGPTLQDKTVVGRARSWVLSSFPLLGALATAFRFIEDRDVCQRLEIAIAAVCEATMEVWFNPVACLDEDEARFVVAHELLHVGLRHIPRRLGRDPYLWNVACDYVINHWLIEMHVGRPPAMGLLYDPQLAGLSAESVYDRIVGDMRTLRRLSTFRGRGEGDMLERPVNSWPSGSFDSMTDLDAFYRDSLSRGLLAHQEQGRGLLPAGLIEEIWAVGRPPMPWDVALARLFDEWFPGLEARRTYARPSRRQASTPDIPRPRTRITDEQRDNRTFGVVLDTSASMDRVVLATALGTIANYAMARDVGAVRFVQCDAAPHDDGYVVPESLAGRVRILGRGGTILQPGIELLLNADDFPPDAPILVVTDGRCDNLNVPRPHAFLLPNGARLPFMPHGPVFHVNVSA